jgi:hypothetical protein
MISKKPNQEKTPSLYYRLNPFEDQWVQEEIERHFLLQFNDLLDAKANVFFLNEAIIAELILDLDNHIEIQNEDYWLTLARIHELALLCAENYANNAEFSLVGDLLINPRLILVHVSGLSQPIPKKRHTPLSVQFKDVGDSLLEIRNWLKTETLVEIKTEALLPDLLRRLENSGLFDQEFLNTIERRKRQVADLIGLLASGGITDNMSLLAWLNAASPADRTLMESSFCPIDSGWFFELGRQVRERGRSFSNSEENFSTLRLIQTKGIQGFNPT